MLLTDKISAMKSIIPTSQSHLLFLDIVDRLNYAETLVGINGYTLCTNNAAGGSV